MKYDNEISFIKNKALNIDSMRLSSLTHVMYISCFKYGHNTLHFIYKGLDYNYNLLVWDLKLSSVIYILAGFWRKLVAYWCHMRKQGRDLDTLESTIPCNERQTFQPVGHRSHFDLKFHTQSLQDIKLMDLDYFRLTRRSISIWRGTHGNLKFYGKSRRNGST